MGERPVVGPTVEHGNVEVTEVVGDSKVQGLKLRDTKTGEADELPIDGLVHDGFKSDLSLVAGLLARCGECLRAGEFIIAGSITPPLFLDADDREIAHEVEGLGSVSVRFKHR